MRTVKAQLRVALRPSTVVVLAVLLSLSGGPAATAALGADFTFAPAQPLVGETVTFTAIDTKPVETVAWDFDGDLVFDATGTTVQHTYASAGTRTVVMRITRPGNQARDTLKTVVVSSPPAGRPPPPPNRAPAASFTFFPRAPLTGESIEFVSTSSGVDDPIVSHAWDLDGDGQFDDAVGVSATRSYSSPGQRTVRLRVSDARGAADIESRTITIGARLTSSPGPPLMSPFPVVRIIGRSTASRARIKLLMVRSAPRGARVTVRCRGRGCGRRRQTRVVGNRRLRFRAFERVVRPGTRIQIFVTQRGTIGKYTSFRIRARRPPRRRDLCVTSVRAKPTRCPSA